MNIASGIVASPKCPNNSLHPWERRIQKIRLRGWIAKNYNRSLSEPVRNNWVLIILHLQIWVLLFQFYLFFYLLHILFLHFEILWEILDHKYIHNFEIVCILELLILKLVFLNFNHILDILLCGWWRYFPHHYWIVTYFGKYFIYVQFQVIHWPPDIKVQEHCGQDENQLEINLNFHCTCWVKSVKNWYSVPKCLISTLRMAVCPLDGMMLTLMFIIVVWILNPKR